ncbi:MAG TPA: hypothetical protein VG722_02045, partial [Tepidisphaeraceae bacterium]|nr:hypothetical protein [Tepidisphaeraceae bacterium]
FKGPGVDLIPSNQSQAVEDQLGRFPMQYMSILTSPQGFYAVHIDPLKADYGYDDPILVRISLQNVCGIDLTVGDDGLIHPTVLIDAQQRGVGDKAFGGIAYDYLGASQILHAGDEISQIVRIDQGSFGLMLLNNPEMTLQFTLLATTNAIPTRDRIFIGLGGYRYQMPRIIQRSSAPLSSDTGRQRVMAMLGGDNGGDRIRGIVLLANYAAQYLSDPNSAAEQKKAAADLLGAIAQTLDDSSPCVQAMGAFALARVQSSQKHWDAMTKLADDPNWQKQLLSAFGLQGAPIELQKTVDQKLAAGDHDPIVKKYAAARLASLEKTK